MQTSADKYRFCLLEGVENGQMMTGVQVGRSVRRQWEQSRWETLVGGDSEKKRSTQVKSLFWNH